MDKKTKTRGKAQGKANSGFEQELGPLTKAIDNAVAGIQNPKQRQEVRQAVGEAVHGAMKDLALRAKGPAKSVGPLDEGAISRPRAPSSR